LIGIGDLGPTGIWQVWDPEGSMGPSSVFDISDLVNKIIEYCDDEMLFKLSQLNRNLRRLLLHDTTIRGKDF